MHTDAAATPLPATPYYDRMRAGHLLRTGHELVAHHVYVGGGIHEMVRECCGAKDGA